MAIISLQARLPGSAACTDTFALFLVTMAFIATTLYPLHLVPVARAQDPDFECAWRKAAMRYAIKLRPTMTQFERDALHESLATDNCTLP
eukprot:UC1_evm1s1066